MAKILVTGGLGFIGSHTVVELVNAGYEPVIVDDLSNSQAGILEQLTKIIGFTPIFYKLDLTLDADIQSLVLAEPDIEGIIHFAAFKAVGESVNLPMKYYRNNFYSLINLLEAYYSKPVN
ncbi:MAG: galE, partial [Mucilaginibacter sp.]|nr:galE [Mucilaginibacter sp.]